jgi:two-component system, OmpR family, sensor histidine kinase KdpD
VNAAATARNRVAGRRSTIIGRAPVRNSPIRIWPWLSLPIALTGVSALALWSHANATTAGFLYLLVVLAVATWGGWLAGFVAALAAVICFNYFFLPPFGTLTIAEPANWLALITFLGASALASRLVASAREGASAAEERRREVQALYDLCVRLFSARPGPTAVTEAAALTLSALGAEAGTLLLGSLDSGDGEPLHIGGAFLDIDPVRVRAVRTTHMPYSAGGILYLPLEVGGHLNGVLACDGMRAGETVGEAATRLLALAIERERLHAEAANLEAVRASEALRTSLLRAVSHDLRTPLTSIRLEIESLSARLADSAALADSLRSLGREQERLSRRIDNLLSSARLESGLARPHPEPVEPAELFRAGRESLATVLAERRVQVRVQPDCPPLWVDPSLALEMLVNLLENAARATTSDALLELVAWRLGNRVSIEVRDRGVGLPSALQQLLQRRAEGGPARQAGAGHNVAGGLGLLITRSFAEASGGSLALLPRPGGGTLARLEIPAAPESSST